MSKIEKALDKARQNRGMALVRTHGSAPKVDDAHADKRREVSVTRPGQDVLTRTASVAAIARMAETDRRDKGELAVRGIISPEFGENPTMQAFREIRTRLLQHAQGQNGVILVTSAVADGGGSFVATNLSVAFAFDAGRTALLVDCNLHNPRLQDLLQDAERTGITDYLDNPKIDLGDIIHSVGIDRLRVIPVGTRRDVPSEYFMSTHVRQLFAEIRNRYPERFVILDAPPMTESADTQILIELCDYVLLVVPYGKLTPAQIDSHVKSIDSQKLIGIVFNNEPQLPPLRLSVRELWTKLVSNVLAFARRIPHYLRELVKTRATTKSTK